MMEAAAIDLVAKDAKKGSKARWLFVHDHHFVPTPSFIGSRNGFGASLWERYLRHCDRLTVIGREGPPAAQDELIRSSHDRVRFDLLPDRGRSFSRLLGSKADRSILARQIANHDVVIARIPSVLGLAAISIAKKIGKPIAVEVVGCAWSAMWDHGSSAGRAFAPLHWAQMRQAVATADNVIYVTDQFLQNRYPTQAHNVSNASNVELPAAGVSGNQATLDPGVLEKRLGRIRCSKDEVLRLGLIGSLRIRSKGIQFVLAALPALRNYGRPVSFHVLGAGDKRPWIDEAAHYGVTDLVTFDGTLPEGKAVFDWLDRIDVYLQPSLQEGLPRALIEAMSRGCPAIGSNCAGIPELLDNRMIVPMRNASALCDKVAALMVNLEEMKKQAERNFTTAHTYVSPVLAARRYSFFNKIDNTSLAGYQS